MDSEIVIRSRTLDQHHDEQEPHHAIGHHHEGGDEEHHEKKSVLKKVKAKAKKIKDTITKHAHGDHHDEHHDGQHIPDDHDLDEEEDGEDEEEEDEMVRDPEIHGAPIYESAAMKSGVHGEDDYLAHPPGVHFERSNATRDAPMESGEKHQTRLGVPIGISSLPKENVITEPPKIGFGSKMAMEKGTPSPANTPVLSANRRTDHAQPENLFTTRPDPRRTFVGQDKSAETKVILGSAMGLKEDPNGVQSRMSGSSVSSNAQSKVADPPGAGTEEIGVTPIIDSLGKMKIHDDSEVKVKPDVTSNSKTRSYQLPSAGSHDQFNPEPMATDTITQPSHEGHPRQEPKEKQANQESYSGMISSATTAIADKAVSAKNVLASKLGYAEKDENRDTAIKNEEGEVVKQDKGVSVTDYLAEKLRPGEDDKALSEVISDALHKRKAEPSKTEERPLERVTESEEVARQLGTGDDSTSKREQESYMNSPGTGVIDKLKGAVGSWFGRSQESQTSLGVDDMSRNTRKDVGKETISAEGRRPQE